jgi:hypothetical protein
MSQGAAVVRQLLLITELSTLDYAPGRDSITVIRVNGWLSIATRSSVVSSPRRAGCKAERQSA